MTIYIVTFYSSQENYGQLLQAFALQHYLEGKGHHVSIVRNSEELNSPTAKNILKHKLRTTYYLRKHPFLLCRLAFRNAFDLLRGKFRIHRIDRGFDKFRQKHLHLTDKVYSYKELQHLSSKVCDALYITGSDQVWNSGKPVYYLAWVPESYTKIAYASSFGRANFPDEFIEKISPWLKSYTGLSVRENGGVDVCRKAGINNVDCVPDPTLLLNVSAYEKLAAGHSQHKRKYLLLYLLGTRTNINIQTVYDFADRRGLEVVYVGAQGRIDTYAKMAPSVEEWLSLVRDATFVVTNSFHGVVFSLLFNRDFMAYLLSGSTIGMNDRLYTILNKVGLEDRISTDGMYINDESIDYAMVNDRIHSYRQTGIQFIDRFI